MENIREWLQTSAMAFQAALMHLDRSSWAWEHYMIDSFVPAASLCLPSSTSSPLRLQLRLGFAARSTLCAAALRLRASASWPKPKMAFTMSLASKSGRKIATAPAYTIKVPGYYHQHISIASTRCWVVIVHAGSGTSRIGITRGHSDSMHT